MSCISPGIEAFIAWQRHLRNLTYLDAHMALSLDTPIMYAAYGLDVKSLLCYGADYRPCEKMLVGLN
jgi:hypothetical protein